MRPRGLRTRMATLGLAAALAGCGSKLPPPSQSQSYLPNIAQVETSIGQSVLSRAHVKVTVTCPNVVPEIKGETFSCIAFSPRGKHRVFTFLVTEQGGTYVSYRQTS